MPPIRLSYLHNGNFYADMMTYLYRITPLGKKLFNKTKEVLLKMFILPAIKDHLLWNAIYWQFSGCFIQVSLHIISNTPLLSRQTGWQHIAASVESTLKAINENNVYSPRFSLFLHQLFWSSWSTADKWRIPPSLRQSCCCSLENTDLRFIHYLQNTQASNLSNWVRYLAE